MCQFHLQGLEGDLVVEVVYFQLFKMEVIHGSETSAYYILTPGTHPKEHIQYSYHGESLKSTILHIGYTKPNLLMLCKAKVDVCCEIRTKHINAM